MIVAIVEFYLSAHQSFSASKKGKTVHKMVLLDKSTIEVLNVAKLLTGSS